MEKKFRNYSTVAEHLPRHFKDEGSIPATTADTLLLEPWKAQCSIKP